MSTHTLIKGPCTNDCAKIRFIFENQLFLIVNKWKLTGIRQFWRCKNRLT